MPSYFFPCLALAPGDLPLIVETPQAALRRRQWETTTFDFATLGASHRLQFSWHLLDVFLNACHLEIEIRDAADFPHAQERVRILQVMLYLQWVSPFIMPVGMTHTSRDYSGLNYRDSATMRAKLPLELQSGFVSTDGKIEGWLHEPTFQSITAGGADHIGEGIHRRGRSRGALDGAGSRASAAQSRAACHANGAGNSRPVVFAAAYLARDRSAVPQYLDRSVVPPRPAGEPALRAGAIRPPLDL